MQSDLKINLMRLDGDFYPEFGRLEHVEVECSGTFAAESLDDPI